MTRAHLALLVRSVWVPGMLSRTFSFHLRQPAPMFAVLRSCSSAGCSLAVCDRGRRFGENSLLAGTRNVAALVPKGET